MTRILLLVALSICVVPTTRAAADPIPIVSYDVTSALVSGSGGWSHTYTGTITPTSVPGVNTLVANYSGGGGTLNDGVIGTSVDDTQLFDVAAQSIITLYFGGFYRVNGLSLFGGNNAANSVPGRLRGTVMVTANTLTAEVPAVPFGPFRSATGTQVNDRLSLSRTPLNGIFTDRITLSRFHSEFLDDRPIGYYSFTEITVDNGAGSPVPEPATLTLLGTGLLGAVVRIRRNRLRAARHC